MNAAAGEARRFPWDDVIALGLGLLRLGVAAGGSGGGGGAVNVVFNVTAQDAASFRKSEAQIPPC